MRIDVPRAPGLGLMLDEIHYERYNKRFANDGIHESLTWEDVDTQVEAFKDDFIFSEMVQGEKNEHSMFEWLKCLPMHAFQQRHFENDYTPRSPFKKAEVLGTILNKSHKNIMSQTKLLSKSQISENNPPLFQF